VVGKKIARLTKRKNEQARQGKGGYFGDLAAARKPGNFKPRDHRNLYGRERENHVPEEGPKKRNSPNPNEKKKGAPHLKPAEKFGKTMKELAQRRRRNH